MLEVDSSEQTSLKSFFHTKWVVVLSLVILFALVAVLLFSTGQKVRFQSEQKKQHYEQAEARKIMVSPGEPVVVSRGALSEAEKLLVTEKIRVLAEAHFKERLLSKKASITTQDLENYIQQNQDKIKESLLSILIKSSATGTGVYIK